MSSLLIDLQPQKAAELRKDHGYLAVTEAIEVTVALRLLLPAGLKLAREHLPLLNTGF